jgi:hypothetical protein
MLRELREGLPPTSGRTAKPHPNKFVRGFCKKGREQHTHSLARPRFWYSISPARLLGRL